MRINEREIKKENFFIKKLTEKDNKFVSNNNLPYHVENIRLFENKLKIYQKYLICSMHNFYLACHDSKSGFFLLLDWLVTQFPPIFFFFFQVAI